MGLGDFLSGIFDSKNEEKAKGFDVDNNAYEYGGRQGGAEAAANEMRGLGNIQRQQGDQFTGIAANQFGTGQGYLDQSQGARAGQANVANQFMQRAGGQNLIANMVADRARKQAISANASSAASARGPAGLALAGQNEMNQNANAAGQIGEAQMIQGANESLQNLNAAGQTFGAMRGGDIGAAQTSYGAAGTAGQIGLGHGQLGLGYTNQQNQINAQQLASQQNKEAQKSANALGAQGINSGVGGQNAAMNQANVFGALNMGGSVAGMVAGGGGGGGGGVPPKAAAGGGPLEARTPYLVGEKGPELIIPSHDGYVVPADQTQALLSRAAPRAGGGGIQAGGQVSDAQAAQLGAQADEQMAAYNAALQKPVSVTYPGGHQVPAAPPSGNSAPAYFPDDAPRMPGPHETRLSPDEEARYQQWKQRNAPRDSGADYDLRGAYRSGYTPDASGHWPDTYKKPNHPTFSNESTYARGAHAGEAGRWDGEKFVPAPSNGSDEQRLQQRYIDKGPRTEADPRPTWGTGTPDVNALHQRMVQNAERTTPPAPGSTTISPNEAGRQVRAGVEGLHRKDEELLSKGDAYEANEVELPEREQREVEGARRRSSADKKRERGSMAKGGQKFGPAAIAGAALKSAFKPADIDVGYHGPSAGYVPPQLLSVAPRAMGGGVMAGGMPISAMAPTAAGTYDVINGGGMDVMGSLRQHAGAGTAFVGNPIAREDGGPVKSGGEPPAMAESKARFLGIDPMSGAPASAPQRPPSAARDPATSAQPAERSLVVIDTAKDNERASPPPMGAAQTFGSTAVPGMMAGAVPLYAQALRAAAGTDPKDVGEAAMLPVSAMGGVPAWLGSFLGSRRKK